jgi:hypothetical protein
MDFLAVSMYSSEIFIYIDIDIYIYIFVLYFCFSFRLTFLAVIVYNIFFSNFCY